MYEATKSPVLLSFKYDNLFFHFNNIFFELFNTKSNFYFQRNFFIFVGYMYCKMKNNRLELSKKILNQSL
ncbi:MAG: hypothetical protein A2309_05120 [Bacteroidetes bacterium RIFOXYB2_FULL_35_7]|nr:MAG: hypothetical protein A2X01_20500 [Bacteroidetes bacterium GWF2_35_48]OFY93433.1 MAG: hypothetical protein A2491_10815 [Bacteroidetes bacterium RIFOXYC12_FULL_35_7]OFY94921.1 MAG: hypothetical protein A2309_05120 [Bacteroidetes bacterium RIFOXYB2_FULL_35_7]HBX50268.1 hypothetical protein [Bacteroidales bacterium]